MSGDIADSFQQEEANKQKLIAEVRAQVIEECAKVAEARAATMRVAAISARKAPSGAEFSAAEVYRNQADYALLIGADIRALSSLSSREKIRGYTRGGPAGVQNKEVKNGED